MTSSDPNHHALVRLANAIQRRGGGDRGREFVVFVAEIDRTRRGYSSSDDLATQQIPRLRDVR